MGSRRTRIEFGTSGWRGVVGRDFTAAGARALVRAIGERVARRVGAGASIVIGHDTRPGGESLAREAAGVLRGLGLRPLLCAGATPTPVVSFTVRRRRAAAGLVFTASHNPPEYQGLKWIAPDGGAAPASENEPVARRANALLGRVPAPSSAAPRPILPAPAYQRALLGRLDTARLSRVRVLYDALHGSGAGWLDGLLREAGARVETLRGDAAGFGRAAPDPRPERLGVLRRRVRAGRGRRLGLATDGDSDRFAVVDSSGAVLAESDALALLIDHLAAEGRLRRGLALSHMTGSLPERVARAHGLAVQRHPIGFKHLTRALAAREVDVAGEESGGFAWAPLAHDKDGILAGALLAEMAGSEPDALRRRLARLRERHGPWRCGRVAIPDDIRLRRALRRLSGSSPTSFDGAAVRGVDLADGLRLELEDGFVAWRTSGTEPVLRIYAEAPGPRLLARRIALARRALGRR
jgi:phosphomannomutase